MGGEPHLQLPRPPHSDQRRPPTPEGEGGKGCVPGGGQFLHAIRLADFYPSVIVRGRQGTTPLQGGSACSVLNETHPLPMPSRVPDYGSLADGLYLRGPSAETKPRAGIAVWGARLARPTTSAARWSPSAVPLEYKDRGIGVRHDTRDTPCRCSG